MKQGLEGTKKLQSKKEIKIVPNKLLLPKKSNLPLHYPKLTNKRSNTNQIIFPSISTNSQVNLTQSNHSNKSISPFKRRAPIAVEINEKKTNHKSFPINNNKKHKEDAMNILNRLENASVVIQKHVRRHLIYKKMRPILHQIAIFSKQKNKPMKLKNQLDLPNTLHNNNSSSDKNKTHNNKLKEDKNDSSCSLYSEISIYSLHTQSIDISSDGDSFDFISNNN